MSVDKVTVGFLHPGKWHSCFAHSMQDLLLFDATHRQRILSHKFGQIGKETHAARIHRGRNDLARDMLAGEADWLFMVDSDMGFNPSVVEELLEAADKYRRPVLGGLCFGQQMDGWAPHYARRYRIVPTLYRMYETDDRVGFVPMFDYPREQVVEVDGTGGACVLIHRKALEKVRDTYGPHWFDPIQVPKGDPFTEFSEDLSFCLRLKACGVKVHVDTRVKTTHDKGGVFLDEETFDVQQHYRELIGAKADDL